MVLRRIPLFILFFSITMLSAQVNSPYSRYGLGNIFPTTFGASNGLGGMSAAYFTPNNINYTNPASYADISYTTFDVGAYGNVLTLENDLESYTSGDGNLSYMAFGFPMLKKLRHSKFGLSFGLIPYSAFEYNIIQEEPTDDPVLGTKEYNYVGDGKLYQIYGGLGYKYQSDTVHTGKIINKEPVTATNIVSIGANAAQLFGSLYNITYASFPEQVNSQTTKLTRSNNINGGIYNMGIGLTRQYTRTSGTARDFLVWRIGGSMSPQIDVNGEQSVLWTNIFKTGNYESVTDTIYMEPDTTGNITLPASYQGGLAFSFFTTEQKDKNQFTLSAQYNRTNWSTYKGFQDAGQLGDSWRVTVGGELFTKAKATNTKVSEDKNQRVFNTAPWTIRFAVYSGQSNLIIDGVQLNDRGISSGFSVPLGVGKEVQSTLRNSRLNFFVNAGQRGSNTTITETYYNFGVGFTIVDMGWFQDYKLN